VTPCCFLCALEICFVTHLLQSREWLLSADNHVCWEWKSCSQVDVSFSVCQPHQCVSMHQTACQVQRACHKGLFILGYQFCFTSLTLITSESACSCFCHTFVCIAWHRQRRVKYRRVEHVSHLKYLSKWLLCREHFNNTYSVSIISWTTTVLEPGIVMVCVVCPSVCLAHANISETKQDRELSLLWNWNKKPGFLIQNVLTDLQSEVFCQFGHFSLLLACALNGCWHDMALKLDMKRDR